MAKALKILFVEDEESDAVLVSHELSKGGLRFRLKRVDTRDAFLHELKCNPPHVIFSDHGLPAFDGFTALALARALCPGVPFIFVTSLMGEQMTIEAFEKGASGYVLKGQLSRLVPVVQRALLESERDSLSHDLLTSLLQISKHAQKLQAETTHPLDERSKHHVEIIAEEALKMGRLLDLLLDGSATRRD